MARAKKTKKQLKPLEVEIKEAGIPEPKEVLEILPPDPDPAPQGRPTIFSIELGKQICARLAEGESLRSICRGYDMPAISTVMYWLLDEDKKDFLEQYKVARDIQADLMVEEMLEIADDGSNDYIERFRQDGESYTVVNAEHIQRSRLRIDTRKWTASKIKPKKYGDKLDLTSDGEKLPIPLLSHALLDNDSDPESTEAA